MINTTYTIYWSHPHRGDGTFNISAPDAKTAADWAADEITYDFYDHECENEYDYEDTHLLMDVFKDDLEVEVYEGTCLVKPCSPPLAIF